jgi:hypothetical protein
VAVVWLTGWADKWAGAAKPFFFFFFSFSFYLFLSLPLLRRRLVDAYGKCHLVLLMSKAQLVILKKGKRSRGKDLSCNWARECGEQRTSRRWWVAGMKGERL